MILRDNASNKPLWQGSDVLAVIFGCGEVVRQRMWPALHNILRQSGTQFVFLDTKPEESLMAELAKPKSAGGCPELATDFESDQMHFQDITGSVDWEALRKLADNREVIVIVASPDRFHAEQAVDALRELPRIHAVVIEKPIADSLEDIAQLRKADREKILPLEHYLAKSSYTDLAAQVLSSRHEVARIRVSLCEKQGAGYRDVGHAFKDLGCHCLLLALHLTRQSLFLPSTGFTISTHDLRFYRGAKPIDPKEKRATAAEGTFRLELANVTVNVDVRVGKSVRNNLKTMIVLDEDGDRIAETDLSRTSVQPHTVMLNEAFERVPQWMMRTDDAIDGCEALANGLPANLNALTQEYEIGTNPFVLLPDSAFQLAGVASNPL